MGQSSRRFLNFHSGRAMPIQAMPTQALPIQTLPTYDDLYIRDTLDDTGKIPSGAATAYKSPDVVVWGTQTIPDPDIYLVENYDTAWYRNVVVGEKNYIYCRATNLYPMSQTGVLYLYYAPGGVMTDVGVWRNNQLSTAIPGQNYVKLDARQPGAVVVGDTAFEWTPEQTGHYCFVAQITTLEHPNPLPQSFASTDEYYRWVIDNPAVAWRNVTVLDNLSPPQYQQDFGFQNLDSFEREYIFLMTASGLPSGSLMAMFCAALGPVPPIGIKQTSQLPNWSLTQTSWLPASFTAALTATVELPAGAHWTGDMSVTIEAIAFMQPQDSDYLKSFARPVAELGINAPNLTESGTVGLRLGSYTIQTMTEETLPAAAR